MHLYRSVTERKSQKVLLLGRGLIGREIGNALGLRGYTCVDSRVPLWNDPAALETSLKSILSAAHDRKLTVIWSAGSCGFNADENQVQREKIVFELIVTTLHGTSPVVEDVNFIMLSSAGGLFEGQRLVDAASSPSPRRPYGELKLWEENLAKDSFSPRNLGIFRLSTVFGVGSGLGRRGLIAALIDDVRMAKATLITGSMDTLRDYVYVDDLGEFIVRRVLQDKYEGMEWLVAAKPSSIWEIVRLVESRVGKKVMVRYCDQASNGNDISFSSTLRPEDWHPSNIETSLARCLLT